MNVSLSPYYVPDNLVSRDGFGSSYTILYLREKIFLCVVILLYRSLSTRRKYIYIYLSIYLYIYIYYIHIIYIYNVTEFFVLKERTNGESIRSSHVRIIVRRREPNGDER